MPSSSGLNSIQSMSGSSEFSQSDNESISNQQMDHLNVLTVERLNIAEKKLTKGKNSMVRRNSIMVQGSMQDLLKLGKIKQKESANNLKPLGSLATFHA